MIPERIAVVSPCPACLLPSDAFSIWVQHHPAFLTQLIMRSTTDQKFPKYFAETNYCNKIAQFLSRYKTQQ